MIMNMYILLLISLPEAFLNAIIILLFAGAKSKLKVTRENVARFAVTLAAMLAATSIIRPFVTNVIENILLSTVAYIIIFSLIYRLKIKQSALSVVFAILIFSTIENAYLPFIIAYIYKGMGNFINDYKLFFIYSLPERLIQTVIAIYVWKYEILMITKISKRFQKAFLSLSLIMVIVEYLYAYLFYTYFDILPLIFQIISAVILILLVTIFNFMIFKTAYIAIGDILSKGYKQYKELESDAQMAFSKINNLLKDNKIDEAIKLINALNSDIT